MIDIKENIAESIIDILENNEVEEEVKIIAPAVDVKAVIFGMVLGAFLGIVWRLCTVIYSGKLQFSYELSQVYNIPSLGIYRIPQKTDIITRWLYMLKYQEEAMISAEAAADFICTNLEMLCKRENLRQICCCGTQMKNIEPRFLELIREKMKDIGVIVLYLDDIRHDPVTLRTSSDSGIVILIEQVGLSSYQGIREEMGIMEREKVNVAGCICIDKRWAYV